MQHQLQGTCDDFTDKALLDHFVAHKESFPSFITLEKFKKLSKENKCDVLLSSSSLSEQAIRDIIDAVADMALDKKSEAFLSGDCKDHLAASLVQHALKFAKQIDALKSKSNTEIRKMKKEEICDAVLAARQKQQVLVDAAAERLTERLTTPIPEVVAPQPIRVEAVPAILQEKWVKTKDKTTADCQPRPPKRWVSANKAKGIAKGYCETDENYDSSLERREEAREQAQPPVEDKPYLLEEDVCNKKDKKRLVEYMLEWKAKGYFSKISESKIKTKLTTEELCDILFKSRQRKSTKVVEQPEGLPTTMIAKPESTFLETYPRIALLIDNMIQEIINIISAYYELLTVPQKIDAPFGIRDGYYDVTVGNLENKLIGPPVVRGILLDHIIENVLPLASIRKKNEYSIPDLTNRTGAKYNFANLEIKLREQIHPELKKILDEVLKKSGHPEYFTEEAVLKLLQFMRQYVATICEEEKQIVDGSKITTVSKFLGYDNIKEIINRSKNIWPRYDPFSPELIDKYKILAALSWIIIAGTDWLGKQDVDTYDLASSLKILFYSIDDRREVIMKCLDAPYSDESEEFLKLARIVFSDAEVYPSPEMLKKIVAICDHIDSQPELVDWLHSSQRLDMFAQKIGRVNLAKYSELDLYS